MQGDRDQGQDQLHEEPARQALTLIRRITTHQGAAVASRAYNANCDNLIDRRPDRSETPQPPR
jgi:hypothetical protein